VEFPELRGEIARDDAILERYSTDMSGYHVRPRLVALPEDDGDIEKLIEFSSRTRTPLTSRGAGSNLSGSAVGPGIVVVFKRMNRILRAMGKRVRVQPGVVYEKLNREMSPRGLSLRYDVSSGGFSTIGGNVATKAGGLRSIKYGNVDTSLKSIRFYSPVFGMVDTGGRLPPGLERDISMLSEKLLSDRRSLTVYNNRRNLKSSSGYNLGAILVHDDPRTILTHLMAGSVGTLGVFAELEMGLVSIPEKRVLITAFFRNIVEACQVTRSIVDLQPSAIEVMDSYGTELVCELRTIRVPENGGATLLIEFDENLETGQDHVSELLEKNALSFHLTRDHDEAERVWNIRWTMLTRIKKKYEDGEHRFISFVDDMAVPTRNLVPFVRDMYEIFTREQMRVIVYGHIGEGNLHIRPLIEKKGWKNRVLRIAGQCFDKVLLYNGTLTAEHGSGRNRAPYLADEWGKNIYGYFKNLKELFDPDNLLNPDIMFSDRDLTRDYRF
jgi:FAD/FMN-containing dehydrogenase